MSHYTSRELFQTAPSPPGSTQTGRKGVGCSPWPQTIDKVSQSPLRYQLDRSKGVHCLLCPEKVEGKIMSHFGEERDRKIQNIVFSYITSDNRIICYMNFNVKIRKEDYKLTASSWARTSLFEHIRIRTEFKSATGPLQHPPDFPRKAKEFISLNTWPRKLWSSPPDQAAEAVQ